MDRRAFLGTLAGLAAPLAAEAQQVGKAFRLGILSPGASSRGQLYMFEALGELGYVEGGNLTVERRNAEGKSERLPEFATGLVQRRVDLIVAVSAPAVQAARQATASIPIVMAPAGEPVERGFAASFARPGGNITGVTYAEGPEIAAKRLELIREAVPRAGRIAALIDERTSQYHLKATKKAASSLGVKLIVVTVQGANYGHAFATMAAERPAALVVLASVTLNRDRRHIIDLAARHRLPAIYEWPEHADEGGFIGYGMSSRALYRRVASFVDRIFKGAKPADLPIEQPTKFELVINLKTARTLGLTIPPSVLARAGQVIE